MCLLNSDLQVDIHYTKEEHKFGFLRCLSQIKLNPIGKSSLEESLSCPKPRPSRVALSITVVLLSETPRAQARARADSC